MITIIGAGWYGCYIGLKCKQRGIKFEILEKGADIFLGSSGFNQNRLHQGFHYPRDHATRKISKVGFDLFNSQFPELSTEIKHNLYAVHEDSYLDYQTYLSIFSHEKYQFKEIDQKQFNIFDNYEGVIAVEERLIDSKRSRKFFLDQNLPIKFNTICSYHGENIFADNKKIESDIIFDCTYGQLKCPDGFFNENFLSFVYLKKNPTFFDALTVMNGEFYSIYPYYDKKFTVTGVKEGIIDLTEYKEMGKESYIQNKRERLEAKIMRDYGCFLDDFIYSTYFISIKTKPVGNTDKRTTFIMRNGNVITVCSGKIDTVFECNEVINSILESVSTEVN